VNFLGPPPPFLRQFPLPSQSDAVLFPSICPSATILRIFHELRFDRPRFFSLHPRFRPEWLQILDLYFDGFFREDPCFSGVGGAGQFTRFCTPGEQAVRNGWATFLFFFKYHNLSSFFHHLSSAQHDAFSSCVFPYHRLSGVDMLPVHFVRFPSNLSNRYRPFARLNRVLNPPIPHSLLQFFFQLSPLAHMVRSFSDPLASLHLPPPSLQVSSGNCSAWCWGPGPSGIQCRTALVPRASLTPLALRRLALYIFPSSLFFF